MIMMQSISLKLPLMFCQIVIIHCLKICFDVGYILPVKTSVLKDEIISLIRHKFLEITLNFKRQRRKIKVQFEMIPKTWKRRGRSIQYGSHGAYTNSLSHVRGIQTHLVFALPTSLTITNVQYLECTMTNVLLPKHYKFFADITNFQINLKINQYGLKANKLGSLEVWLPLL